MHEVDVRFKFWLEVNGVTIFGAGGAVLLEKIEATGSLSGAAAALGMSYRRAWGRLKKLEEAIGDNLVVKTGGNKKGYQLSGTGRQFLTSYREAAGKMTEAAQDVSRNCFGWIR